MSDLRLDETTHDLQLDVDDLVLTVGSDATKQRIKQALLAFRNEWFLDLSDGVPYYEDILVKNPNPSVVEDVLREVVLEVPGVLELVSFSLDYDGKNRQLLVSGEARSNEDVIDFTQIIGST